MVTNNYYAMLMATRLNIETSCKSVEGTDNIFPNSYNKDYKPAVANIKSSDLKAAPCSFSIFIGSGSAPTLPETYRLENEVVLFASNLAMTVSDPSGAMRTGLLVLSRLFTNTGDSPVSVTEAVLTMASNSGSCVVLAREVFEPVILNPGESISIHIKVM